VKCKKGLSSLDNILEMHEISKSFFGVKVLNKVNFNVRRNEIHAICGENGAGKSTLMKILLGVYTKDDGEIYFKGNKLPAMSIIGARDLGISMIFQEINLVNDLSVAQNIFLNREHSSRFCTINEKEMIQLSKGMLRDIEDIDPAQKAGNLGIAQKQIIEIVKAISFNSELIIMDEPTAVLTQNEVEMLFDLMRKLKNNGVTIIYISHRLREIKEICDRVTVLKDGEFVCTKECADVSERDIAKLMVGRELQHCQPGVLDYDKEEEVLRVENVSYKKYVNNISFSVYKGEVLGFYGLVGAGRTELAEILFGINQPDSGLIYLHGEEARITSAMDAIKKKFAFATEDRKKNGLFLGRNIRENTMVVRNLVDKGVLIRRQYEHKNTDEMRQKFNIRYAAQEMEVKNLSGGNQQKIVLSKWILSDAEIIIADEPTRGVDVGSRKEIYEFIHSLSAQGKTIIIISSDIPELLETCHRIIIMHLGEITGELKADEASEERIIISATGIEKGAAVQC